LGDTKGKLLTWLQKVLMECCFVKLRLNAIIEDGGSSSRTVVVAEPMTFHSQCKTIRLNNTRNGLYRRYYSLFFLISEKSFCAAGHLEHGPVEQYVVQTVRHAAPQVGLHFAHGHQNDVCAHPKFLVHPEYARHCTRVGTNRQM
jgi:hypothetical protein